MLVLLNDFFLCYMIKFFSHFKNKFNSEFYKLFKVLFCYYYLFSIQIEFKLNYILIIYTNVFTVKKNRMIKMNNILVLYL